MANLKYFLWLSTRRGLQPKDIGKLLAHFGTPEALYHATRREYELLGLSESKTDTLLDKSTDGAEKIMEDCTRLGIHIMTIQDSDYPERLAQIYDPPCVLYRKGKPLNLDGRLSVSVVGTRSCTPYGELLAGRLGLELALAGAVLVSGMAEGIDSAGIKGALQGKGTVVSVLAGGLDVIYPRQNGWLYEDIAATGTLLSEYPPGTEHIGYHFPLRNRIISGLSAGAVVVEAGEPSGALITARLALEQNREVFAFPGAVNAPASLGCNRLIQRGEAKLVLSAQDILEEFKSLYPNRSAELSEAELAAARERLERLREAAPSEPRAEKGSKIKRADQTEKTEKSEKTTKVVDKVPERAYISLTDKPELFTDDQRDILQVIEKRALTADEICEAVQIPARRVSSALTMLQLEGFVAEKPGKRFYAQVILKP